MASPAIKGRRPPPPPPLIGKAGNLTIFITPPPQTTTTISNSHRTTPNPNLFPVQAPPIRWEGDPAVVARNSMESVFQFLWSALAKAQYVHSSLDSYVADWFGLNHSKYQRELNDYYERMQKPLKNEFGDQTQPKDEAL
ncbi:uncharacterized protein LOC144546299 [Carex rostrata]